MIITTSRRPSTRTRLVCKELQGVIPLSTYVLRGKKGMRDLISLSAERGADRIVIVNSTEPVSFIFYAEWEFLGELQGSVTLRRELAIPKIPPLADDPPFLLKSSEEKGDVIARLFGAELYCGDEAYTYMIYEKGWIDFCRADFDKAVGPRIKVETVKQQWKRNEHEVHH